MDSGEVRQGRLYGELASLMRIITPPEEYREEAAHWKTLLREILGPGRHSILELGVGGGHNLSHLTAEYEATAVDISESMLAQCRKLNPGVRLHLGDMRKIRLNRKFDAVLIHDAISYMLTEDDLLATFHTAAAHLRKGGALITSPDRFLDEWTSPGIEHSTHMQGDTRVTYFEYTRDPDPKDSTVESILVYLIETPEGLRVEHDRHVTGIFPKATWLKLMQEAGFETGVRSFRLQSQDHSYDLFVGKLL